MEYILVIMSLGTVLLGVLVKAPAHGYDMKHAHDSRFPSARPLAYAQVYTTLARLQRDGLVEVLETTPGSGPDRTVYAITEEGRHRLDDWLAAAEDPGPYAADELVRKTITALHLGADADDYLNRQRAAHLAGMRALTRQRDASDELGAKLAIDHTLAHLDADLRWLEETRERVARELAQDLTRPPSVPTSPAASREPQHGRTSPLAGRAGGNRDQN